MPNSIPVLSVFPDPVEFYATYWNKTPFLIKNGVADHVMTNLIPADELAGLSLEDDIRSRIVTKGQSESDWVCQHGPFEEEFFKTLEEENWSLLVQKVEQYHLGTKALLASFDFSPRWLIDDIMVSYSTPGGGVGPHLDSYHVFLVQGMGERCWKVGYEPDREQSFIPGLDLKILDSDFGGDELVMKQGDILYIPPLFPHAGETVKEALTYSVGFLGPSMSELLIEFGHYVEEMEAINSRYDGRHLNEQSSGANMSGDEVQNFRKDLTDIIGSTEFEEWLRSYFAGSD